MMIQWRFDSMLNSNDNSNWIDLIWFGFLNIGMNICEEDKDDNAFLLLKKIYILLQKNRKLK